MQEVTFGMDRQGLKDKENKTLGIAYGTRKFECRIHKGSSIIFILRWINPIPRIDIYFFKIDSIIPLSSTPFPS